MTDADDDTVDGPEPARERASDAVTADTDLTPAERETVLRTAEDRDTLDVYTAERGLMRRLLAHPEADDVLVNVKSGDVGGEAVPLEVYDGGPVVGVKATLPVGCLTVRRDPRTSGTHADMITPRVIRTDGGTDTRDAGDDDAPTTREVARLLDVDGERLGRFVDTHPDMSAEVLLGWADADPEHRDVIDRWLQAREREKRRRRERREPGGDVL